MKVLLNMVLELEQFIADCGSLPMREKIAKATRVFQHKLLQCVITQVNTNVNTYDGLTSEEIAHAKTRDGKIPAIKKVRERTGLGLKEAKDLVENWMQKYLGFTYWPS